MKAELKKIWWSIPLLLVLAAILYYGYLQQDNTSSGPLFFRIGTGDASETISAWYDDKGTYYVFLPSYADISTVTVIADPGFKVEAEGTALTDKTDLSAFTMGETYDIRIRYGRRKVEEARLCFLQSANAAAMFINTQTGNMKRIHYDKDYEEKACAAVFDEDGTKTYVGFNDKLEGRGQATWNNDKKSYLLTLERAHEMLGMNPAEKWVLISNSDDVTNLRNKVIFDLAAKTGLKWGPECQYIDLYLNGDYAGLYLLAEKIEISEQRLDLKPGKDTENISFLCRNEPNYRWNSLRNPFLTDCGRAVEITSPGSLTDSQKQQIMDDVQLMEDTILAGDETDLKKYIDVDSWARKCLIDEIFANIDADLASSYFYCDNSGESPVFYAGPVWDYDQTFGSNELRNRNPYAFYADAEFESSDWDTPYYHALCRKDSFHDRVVEIYKEELLPLVMELENYEIGKQAAVMADAAEMNRIRWLEEEDDTDSSQMIDFLTQRVAFLNEAWLDDTQFFSVQVEISAGKPYLSYAVRPGEKLPALPDSAADGNADPVWYDRDTGEIFDFDQPLTKDTVLLLKQNSAYVSLRQNKAMLGRFAAIGLSSAVLSALMWADFRRNRKKR